MEYRWKQINDYMLVLFGYGNLKIATVEWNNDIGIWELSSEFIDYSGDISDNLGLKDIEEVEKDALEQLKESCDDHINWYKGQIAMIEELYRDMCLK